MLKITIPESEQFNEETNEFITVRKTTLNLEHSLLSISKWEAKWEKPFIGSDKTPVQLLDYIRCMCINSVDERVFNYIPPDCLAEINAYIEAPMTATTIVDNTPRRGKPEIITSELIYYWMITFNIPFECQKWHLERLLTLIRVCAIKNQNGNKMSKREVLTQNRELNEARRKALHTKG